MRLLILPLCLALAGCLTSPDPAPSSEQPAAPPVASDAAPAAQPRANQALRGSSPPPKPAPEAEPGLSSEQRILLIRQICWNDADKQRQLRGNLDARVTWVEKCIADKRKQLAAQPAGQ